MTCTMRVGLCLLLPSCRARPCCGIWLGSVAEISAESSTLLRRRSFDGGAICSHRKQGLQAFKFHTGRKIWHQPLSVRQLILLCVFMLASCTCLRPLEHSAALVHLPTDVLPHTPVDDRSQDCHAAASCSVKKPTIADAAPDSHSIP